MIKEALEYLKELGVSSNKPQVLEIEGRRFHQGELAEIGDPTVKELELRSLSSMVEYVKSKFDKEAHLNRLMIHVQASGLVKLYGPLVGKLLTRHEYCESAVIREGFPFGLRLTPEDFNLQLQMNVEDKFDRAKLLKLSGTVGCEKSMTSYDDGHTQQVSIRKGAVLQETETVPNPVTLSPYRTFSEIEQPSSPFVFRVHDNGPDKLPSLSIHECDGGLWMQTAMQSIKKYLKKALPDVQVLA